MSSDLFAAFSGSFEPPTGQQPPPQQTPTGSSQPSAPKSDAFSILTPSATESQARQSQQYTPWQSHQSPASQPPSQKPQPWPASQQPQRAVDILGTPSGMGGPPTISEVKDEDDDDAWGDFEMPSQSQTTSATTAVPPGPTPVLGSTQAPPSTSAQVPPRTRLVRASTIELMTNSLVDVESLTSRQAAPRDRALPRNPERPPEPRPKITDPNVLFDADDFDGEPPQEDDEFGDFETVPGTVSPPAQVIAPAEQPVIDLMSTDFAPQRTETKKAPPSQLLSTLTLNDVQSPYPTAPRSPSFQERTPFPGLGVMTPEGSEFPRDEKPTSPSPVTAWPSLDGDGKGAITAPTNGYTDDWGTFEDLPPERAKPKAANKSSASTQGLEDAKPAPGWGWDAWDGDATDPGQQPRPVEPSTSTETGPPPTNVPPPSILLSLLPQLLGSVNTYLFKPTSGQPKSINDRVLSDPATVHFLRGYVALATVAGRVMAGRKLRWSRDKFLSQSMTISAAAGGKRGMKLSGIDKSQASHEDREAADVVAAWRELVGRLRTAVAAANSAVGGEQPRLRVPELADKMVVHSPKGVLTAPKACVVCGLKRDERVISVDFEVEDSFGEWWVEFWGHRSCRNFWLEHEAKLRQR